MASVSETLRSSTAFDIEIPNPLAALELDINNLWPGVMLCVYDKNKDKLIEDKNGSLLMVMSQIGGTEVLTPAFYRYEWEDPANLGESRVIDTGERVSIEGSTMFLPIEAYPASKAPNLGRYALYDQNRPVRYKGEFGEFVHLAKDDLGNISFANYPRDLRRDQFLLSKDAVLLRIRDVYRLESKAYINSPVVKKRK